MTRIMKAIHEAGLVYLLLFRIAQAQTEAPSVSPTNEPTRRPTTNSNPSTGDEVGNILRYAGYAFVFVLVFIGVPVIFFSQADRLCKASSEVDAQVLPPEEDSEPRGPSLEDFEADDELEVAAVANVQEDENNSVPVATALDNYR